MARYIGGPCNGQALIDIRAETRQCGGATYVRVGLDYYLESDITGSASGGPVSVGGRGDAGWHDLQKAAGTSLPSSIRRASVAQRATYTKLQQQRRRK